jgi:multiple sugar transport system ATP-binding protein
MASLTLKHVSKDYPGGVRAVSDVNAEIADGEFVILVGPSGCGKSTLLRMIAGLEDITSGEIAIDGRTVNNVHAKDRDIAMVFQNYALYPHMSVAENMAFGLKMRKFDRAEIERRVRETAEVLGLAEYLDRKPGALSGGQRQRVAVGRAIVRQPKLFLFDEPLSNLDARMRVGMRAELIKLHKRLKATMVYVTHDQVEAMSMGDRLVVMKDGVVQQVGAPLEIYNQPANQFVAGFIGSPAMNFLPVEVETQNGTQMLRGDGFRFQWPESAPSLKHSGRAIFGIRPENLHERPTASPTNNGNVAVVRVEIVEALGDEILTTCSLGPHEITARFSPHSQVESDELIELDFDLNRARLFDAADGKALN